MSRVIDIGTFLGIKGKNLKTRVFWYSIFGLSLIVFLLSFLLRVQQPPTRDELHWVESAEHYFKSGIPYNYKYTDIAVYSPHLYIQTIVLAFRIFGDSVPSSRIPGLISCFLTIVLVFFITKSLIQGEETTRLQWAGITTFLYASTPAVIQGSIIRDIDSTILVPLVLSLLWAYFKYLEEGRIRWFFSIIIFTILVLWARIGTTVNIFLILLLFPFFSRTHLKNKITIVSAILSGAMIFVVSWYFYCQVKGLPFSGPFIYFLDVLETWGRERNWVALPQNFIVLILWLGVIPFIIFIVMILKVKEYLRSFEITNEDVFLWVGGIPFLLTLLASGSFYFPKYFSPIFPLLYIFSGFILSKSIYYTYSKKLLWIAIIGFIIQTFILGDIIYTFRYTIRNALVFNLPLSPIFNKIALKIVFSTILLTICLFFVRSTFRKNWVALLPLLSIGFNLGLTFLQDRATYDTGYDYGCRGTVETASYLSENMPKGKNIIAPSEIIYHMKLPKYFRVRDKFWTDLNELKSSLNNKNTYALVYSVPTNSFKQVRFLSTNSEIQKILKTDFVNLKKGTYIIWMRKH